MAKKISASDIFAEEDIFKNIKESAQETIKTFTDLDNVIKKTADKLKKDISGSDFGNTKGINAFVTATQKATKAQEEAVKVDKIISQAKKDIAIADKVLIDNDIKKQKLAQETIKTNNLIAKGEEQKAKATEKSAKATLDEANAYKKLSNNTRDLKNESKMLAVEMLHLEQSGRKNTKEYRELAKTYKQVTMSAQEGDRQLKKIDSTVGDNFRNVGNYTGAVNKLKSGLGQLGLAFGIGSIVQNAGKSIVEFDQKIADLVSITGAGGKDLEFYKQQAIEMGKGVQGGASAVIEAYKLIGSAKPELLNNAKALDAVTQSAITLSQASGMTLPESATALTDAMNQFGAPAEKAGQFIDALANGALLGSAEIPQVTEALLKFGAIAKNANVPIEESVGLIETLAEKGLKGAEAGTALRNVMLKISAPDALPKEAQERLQALGISFDDLKDKSKPFSERLALLKPLLKDNASMVKVFGLENTVSATSLIQNTARIAELTAGMNKQGTASKQAEDRTKTLSFVFNELKESWNAVVLSFTSGEGSSAILVEGLSFIAKNLGTILGLLGKVAIAYGSYLAIQKSVQAYNFVMSGGLKNVASSMLDVFKSGKKAGEGAKLAGEGVSKAGKAITAVPWIAIIGVLIEVATALYDIASGAKSAREQQELLAKANEKADKNVSAVTKRAQDWVAEQKRLLDLEIRNRKSAGESEKKLDEEKLRREKEIEATGLNRIKYAQKVRKEELAQVSQDFDLLKKLQLEIESVGKFANVSPEQQRALNRAGVKYLYELKDKKILSKLAEDSTRLTKEIVDLSASEKEFTDLIDESNVKIQENSNAHENNTGKINAKIPVLEKNTKQMKDANDQMERMNSLMKETQDLIDEIGLFEISANIDSAVQSQLDSIGQSGQYSIDLIKQLIDEEYNLQKAIIERQFLESVDVATNEQEVINAKTKRDFEIGKLEEQRAQKTKSTLKDLENAQEEYADKTIESDNKVVDSAKKTYETQKEFIKLTADYFIKRSNDKIAQLEKEISKAENQYDVLQQLAVNGNINAQESLAEQQRIINEANAQKEKELKRQQRIKLAESVYSTYNSKVASGSEHPLMDTIKDTMLLQQFIASLPTFFDGTEDTGKNGNGIDGKGGFHAVLHPNERVIPKSLNEQIGGLSNEALAKMANEYQNGKIIRSNSQIGSAFDTAILVGKLDELTTAIKQKPETNIGIGEITQSVMEIVKSTKQGNTTTYNRYKVRR